MIRGRGRVKAAVSLAGWLMHVDWRLIVLTLLATLPVAGSLAQDERGRKDDPSPAKGHAEVIAHGVATMPGGDMVWRVETRQALPPNDSRAVPRGPGFILADAGVVALTDQDGRLLARVAPGEAAWTSPEKARAVVSLERDAIPYDDISLVPANALAGGEEGGAGEPVELPTGRAFDLELVRDVLIRNEESDVAAGSGPALLLVTSGMVLVEPASGGTIDLAAGDLTSVSGDTIVTGTSHAPATFVVALVGSEVPPRLELGTSRAPTVAPRLTPPATSPASTPSPSSLPTPTPTPTPTVVPATPAAVTIATFICPVAYAGSDYVSDCIYLASGVELSVMQGEETVRSDSADADGAVTFGGLPAGDYVLMAGVPGDFATSRVRCLNGVGVDIARRHAVNQIDITLHPADEIACRWFVVPENARGDGFAASPTAGRTSPQPAGDGSISVYVHACPPGMTVATLDDATCDASPPGVAISLVADGAPLAATSVEDSLWLWKGLAYRSYDLYVSALPEGYTTYSLGVRQCCNERGALDVATSTETPDTGYILHLFLPASATPLPAARAADDESAAPLDNEAPGTPMQRVDPDGDGLPTSDEVGFFHTDPNRADTDGDGVGDAQEIASGTDPLDGGR